MTNAVNLASAAGTGFMRNRIINGDMRIDQRNAGASGTGNNNYTVDRWYYFGSQTTKGTWQQNAGSVAPPAGFTNYLGFTSSSAYTLAAGDQFLFSQKIEGFNVADFDWGTANAKSITISFFVRSSLTGTFGASVQNGTGFRCYPFSFSIPVANTWTAITITIPGDTSGTWAKDNTTGLILHFSMGTGSAYSATANMWTATPYVTSVPSAVSVVGTNGATFYLTGVQLEAGTVATPFERRMYGQELALCQRYYEVDDIPASGSPKISTGGLAQGTTHYLASFKVSKRTTATVSMTFISSIDNATSAVGITSVSSGAFRGYNTISNGSFFYADAWVRYAASAEL